MSCSLRIPSRSRGFPPVERRISKVQSSAGRPLAIVTKGGDNKSSSEALYDETDLQNCLNMIELIRYHGTRIVQGMSFLSSVDNFVTNCLLITFAHIESIA